MKKYNYIRRGITWEGKRYEVYGKTERETADKLAALKTALKRGEKTVGADSTVDRWFQEWYDLYKVPAGLGTKSLKMYREKYDLYIGPKIGKMKLKDVREVHLQRILNEEAGRSFSLLSKIRMVMKGMFSKAHSTHLILWDPSVDLTLPEYTKGTHRAITEQERAHILAVAKDHWAGLWVLMILYTGIRPGETVPLQWKDIDFVKNEIHIYKAIESGTMVIKDPKTDAGFRDIPISKSLLPFLKAAEKEPLDLVFPTSGGKMRDSKALRRLWTSFKRDLDIHMGAELYRNQIIKSVVAEDLTPYCLRHTFCTDLQRAGVPLNVAKELMGHSDITVTANIYSHNDQRTLHEGINLLDRSHQIVTYSEHTELIFALHLYEIPMLRTPAAVTSSVFHAGNGAGKIEAIP